jgi:hypothetical protein
VSGPDDFDEFVHAAIERHRLDDESFEGEVSLTLATALLVSTNPGNPHASPERMLLRLREWYGPRLERMSVRAFMTHYKAPGSPQVWRLARALWENHQESCQDLRECSLHSLGSLWAFHWLDPPIGEADWLIEAIYTLVAEHPLRSWVRHLVSRAADWVDHGWMSAADAERVLSSAVDAGLHEYLANTELLASSWTMLTDAASPDSLWGLGCQVGGRACLTGVGRRPRLGGEGEGRLVAP